MPQLRVAAGKGPHRLLLVLQGLVGLNRPDRRRGAARLGPLSQPAIVTRRGNAQRPQAPPDRPAAPLLSLPDHFVHLPLQLRRDLPVILQS